MSDLSLPDKIQAHATSRGEAVAVQCGDESINWSEFEKSTRAIAATLIAAGCGAGTRVATLATASVAYIECIVGIIRSGASIVPLPSLSDAGTLKQMLSDSGAHAIFVSQKLQSLAEEALSGRANVLCDRRFGIDFAGSAWNNLAESAGSNSSAAPLPDISPDQEFNLIYSSGTTGTPKGIVHHHRTRTAQMTAAILIGMDAQAATLISTALYANWTLFGLFSALYGGGRTVLLPRFDTTQCLRLVQDAGITHAFFVPVQISRLLAVPDFDRFVTGSHTLKLCAGSPLPISAKQELLRRWPGGLVENYGLTEGAPTTLLFAHLHPEKLESVGSVVSGGEILIIDDEGVVLPPGEVGEVVGRSAAMMSGYHNRAEQTEALEWFDDAGRRFFRSGDFGRLDSDGFLYLMGRKKDVIISGGMNIYASDIEEVLLTHPDVADTAVIGIPSEQWGETPLALVVLREGVTTDNVVLRDWVNSRLGKAQRISAVEIRDDLPRGTLDKVLKKELRQPYWAGQPIA